MDSDPNQPPGMVCVLDCLVFVRINVAMGCGQILYASRHVMPGLGAKP
jgi:hypothetical protein